MRQKRECFDGLAIWIDLSKVSTNLELIWMESWGKLKLCVQSRPDRGDLKQVRSKVLTIKQAWETDVNVGIERGMLRTVQEMVHRLFFYR